MKKFASGKQPQTRDQNSAACWQGPLEFVHDNAARQQVPTTNYPEKERVENNIISTAFSRQQKSVWPPALDRLDRRP